MPNIPEEHIEPIRVVIFAYRDWALRAAERLTNLVGRDEFRIDVIESNDERPISGPKPSVILAIGWSWRIEQPRPGPENYTPIMIFHPSPLPLYRGGSPIQHQILEGETRSALTIFEADRTMDTGPIFSQRAFSLEGRLSAVLKRIEDLSVSGGVEVLDAIRNRTYTTVPQPAGDWPSYKRRNPYEAEITPEMLGTMTGRQLYDFIRCQQPPYPQAFMRGNDGEMIMLDARLPTAQDYADQGVSLSRGYPVIEGVAGSHWKRSAEAARARTLVAR